MTLECRPKRSSRPCERWQRGVCELGEACGFSHEVVPAEDLEVEEESEAEDLEIEEESKDDPEADIEAAQDSGKAEYAYDSQLVAKWRKKVQLKLVVCRHWLNNHCNSKHCRFLHATEKREAHTVRLDGPKAAVPSLEYVDPEKAAAHQKPRMVPAFVKAVALRPHPSTVRKAPQFMRPTPKMGSNNRRGNRIKRVLDSGLEEGDEGPSIPSYESYGLVGAGLDEDDGDGGAAVRGDSPPLVRRRFAR